MTVGTLPKSEVIPMSKVTILPYKPPYCIVCGRDLPTGRTRKCYTCLPPKRHTPRPKPAPELPYTIHDRVAQTVAYGISYGQLISIIETGGKLPPLKRPIVWPEGSAHAGE